MTVYNRLKGISQIGGYFLIDDYYIKIYQSKFSLPNRIQTFLVLILKQLYSGSSPVLPNKCNNVYAVCVIAYVDA